MKTNRLPAGLLAILGEEWAGKSEEELLAAVRQNEALRRELAAHIAFRELMKRAEVTEAILENGSLHTDDKTLGLFLSHRLAPKAEQRLQAHVQTCAECLVKMTEMQSAMKAFAPASSVSAPVELVAQAKQLRHIPAKLTLAAKVLPHVQPPPIRQYVRDFVEEIKLRLEPFPAWGYGLAGVAVATVLLVILLRPNTPVKNLPSNHQLVIFENGPLGFVTENEVIEYKGMSVKLSDEGGHLIFTWAAIPKALFYEISLLHGEKKVTLAVIEGEEKNNFSFPRQNLPAGVEQGWELSGKLKDGRRFMARAGFVLKQ